MSSFFRRSLFETACRIFRILICAPFCKTCKLFLLDTNELLCKDCLDSIEPIVTTTISLTPTKSMTIYAICEYKDPIKKLILAKGRSYLPASRQLGELMWRMTNISRLSFDCIVPIPLHWTRFAWRGYNQAEEIARVLSRLSGKPYRSLLKRNKRTLQQSFFSAKERGRNVEGAFCVYKKNTNAIRGKHILLVDDLLTTGSTVREAGKVLLALKPASITVVVGCRVL